VEHEHEHEHALERARSIAWRALNRRDRTVAELRDRLAGKGVDAEVADAVLAELLEGGYLDDAAFAQRFAEDRRRLDAWGRDRIARRLRELGVASPQVEAALAAGPDGGDEEAAVALLERRFPVAPTERRERDRALGMLLRRGHPLEVALAALKAHAHGVAEESAFAHEPARY